MAQGYCVHFCRSISTPTALADYARVAGPAIQAAGGRFLARGGTRKAYEAGTEQRVVVTEVDSVEKAIAAYESDAYNAALKLLTGAAERDVRIVEGIT